MSRITSLKSATNNNDILSKNNLRKGLGPVALSGRIDSNGSNTGVVGPTGSIGNTGSIGPRGGLGLTGDRGSIGPRGDTGTAGTRKLHQHQPRLCGTADRRSASDWAGVCSEGSLQPGDDTAVAGAAGE